MHGRCSHSERIKVEDVRSEEKSGTWLSPCCKVAFGDRGILVADPSLELGLGLRQPTPPARAMFMGEGMQRFRPTVRKSSIADISNRAMPGNAMRAI